MIRVQARGPEDVAWLDDLLPYRWEDMRVVSRGVTHVPRGLPAFVVNDGERRGVLVACEQDGDYEVVLLHVSPSRAGVGRALMEHARYQAALRGCHRLWLVTTNANTNAQAFYEHLGLTRVAIHAGEIDAARERKPGIPTHDEHGTPIRDEFEYEWDPAPMIPYLDH